jgi:hypothetical protein
VIVNTFAKIVAIPVQTSGQLPRQRRPGSLMPTNKLAGLARPITGGYFLLLADQARSPLNRAGMEHMMHSHGDEDSRATPFLPGSAEPEAVDVPTFGAFQPGDRVCAAYGLASHPVGSAGVIVEPLDNPVQAEALAAAGKHAVYFDNGELLAVPSVALRREV